MNLLLWFFIGIIVGIYQSTIDTGLRRGEAIFVAILGGLIGGFITALVFGYSISGLNPASLIVCALTATFALKYFRASVNNKVKEESEARISYSS